MGQTPSNLVRQTDIEDVVRKSDLDNIKPAPTDLTEYAKLSELANYAKAVDLAGYAKTTDLANYAKAADLANYATTKTVTDYATQLETNATNTLSNYAKLTDLKNYQSVAAFDDSIKNYATVAQVNGLITQIADTKTSNANAINDIKKVWGADGNVVPGKGGLNVKNPDGRLTHFGYTPTSGNPHTNYIRGPTQFDDKVYIGGTELSAFINAQPGKQGPQGPKGDTGTVSAYNGPIGVDGTEWVTGYGGFHAGYLDSSGKAPESKNSFTRDGVNVRRGPLCVKDWCLDQHPTNGNLMFTRAGQGYYELDTKPIPTSGVGKWIGWSNINM